MLLLRLLQKVLSILRPLKPNKRPPISPDDIGSRKDAFIYEHINLTNLCSYISGDIIERVYFWKNVIPIIYDCTEWFSVDSDKQKHNTMQNHAPRTLIQHVATKFLSFCIAADQACRVCEDGNIFDQNESNIQNNRKQPL